MHPDECIVCGLVDDNLTQGFCDDCWALDQRDRDDDEEEENAATPKHKAANDLFDAVKDEWVE